MPRRELLSLRRPLLCRKSQAWYATGIIATPGYVMPPLRSMHSERVVIQRRLMHSLTGCVAFLTWVVMTSRLCMVFEASETWSSEDCSTSKAIVILARYGYGTGQPIKNNW